MTAALRFLLISGSTRGASTNTAALRTARLMAPDGVTAVLFDGLADLPAFTPDDDQDPSDPAVRDLREQLTAADAVLFCTPEYAGALPGSFKNLIDWTVGGGQLYRKPVAWINVAAQGRGAGALAELATVLGYVDAAVIKAACVRLTVPHAAVGGDQDSTVTDPVFRDRIADVLRTMADQVRATESTTFMTSAPFEISVPDAVLADLRARLTRTVFTPASDSRAWAAGVDPGYLRELVGYWAEGFDWRAAEAALNAFPHRTAEVAGSRVHFVHLRGERPEGAPAPLPLILTHGWPSSFVEMLRVAEPLRDPARHGGDPADAFDVVIPSLPGFGYSELPREPFTRRRVAEMWHSLMTQTLGYRRFGAFGGDIGGGVTQWLGALFPGEVAGVHVTSAIITTDFTQQPPTAPEKAYLDALAAYEVDDQGYSEIMSTRPDTLAAALADSPAGLVAWIIDKYRDWSDCAGDLEARWDKDTLLTVATLYWATGSIGSSFRQYYDFAHNEPVPTITVPGAVTLSNEPAYRDMPRSLAERLYADLRHWSTPGRGGHFMAHEEPGQVAAELRSFFRPLRTGS